MELHDYANPGSITEGAYEPRPKASQAVAAAKRARPTHDTEPITPIAHPSTTRKYVPFGVGALILAVLMIGAASYQLGHISDAKPLQITPQATAAPTDAPAAAVAASTAAPTDAPAAAVAASTATPTTKPASATIPAYAAPDGLLLGQIELDRMIVAVAHFGSSWIQADVAGSGLVWLHASDVPDIAIAGPDLAPHAVAPQTGQGLTLADQGESDESPAQPNYLANVGAQASHSPRGGLCGPNGGECAPGVPVGIDNNQYIANVGAQSPHKVR